MKTKLLLLLLALLAGNAPWAGAAEGRVALVIGNAGYRDAPLANPVHDASDVAAALRSLGFHVIVRTDASQREMRHAVEEFGAQLRDAQAGLFYYAGHGLQFDGINHLVPVDALIQGEADIAALSVDANDVLRTMEEARVPVRIVILDACRTNPFAQRIQAKGGARVLSISRPDGAGDLRNGGLAHMSATTGSLIAFATAPGSTADDGSGRNGTYTKHLLASLGETDSDILKVFQRTRAGVVNETGGRQTPWESTSLIGDFRFRQSVTVASPAPQRLSAEPATASPLPTTGDTWTYRLTETRRRGRQAARHQVTVASATPDAIVEQISSGPGSSTQTRHRQGAHLVRQGDLSLFSPYLLAFDSYQPGDVFSRIENLEICDVSYFCSATGRVVGQEVVRVPAGEFQAIKVEVQDAWIARASFAGTGWQTLTLWYSPQAKRVVKVSSRGNGKALMASNFDLELESYRLHGPSVDVASAAPHRTSRVSDKFSYPGTSSANSSLNARLAKELGHGRN